MNILTSSLLPALRSITLEPMMLLDGATNQALLLFVENVQMLKICTTKLGYPDEVCRNMSNHDIVEVEVHREFSLFCFYNSIILSVIPLFYVLFMGGWSDIYGRKIPLVVTTGSHVFYAGIYLLGNWQTSWPLELFYLAAFLESLGGGNSALLTFATSYVSDICRRNTRTARVSTVNSIWYLGGPLGNLVGALLIRKIDLNLALGVCLICYFVSFGYVIVFVKESYGPFAKRSLKAKGSIVEEHHKVPKEITAFKMVKDFFNVSRVSECFKTLFAKREGRLRAILLAIVSTIMIRRAGRCFFMYMFTRRVLRWEAHDFGFWSTYRNTVAAVSSLILVPLLCKTLNLSDQSLVLLGSLSLLSEYVCYGCVLSSSYSMFIWIGPAAGFLANAALVTSRSLPTKLVTGIEKGRISAVIGALNGLMPMVGYSLFSPTYYQTVNQFPSAQFFLAASLVAVTFVTFTIVQLTCRSSIAAKMQAANATTTSSMNYQSHGTPTDSTKDSTYTGIDFVSSQEVKQSTERSISHLPKLHEACSHAQPCSLNASVGPQVCSKAGSKTRFLVIETSASTAGNAVAVRHETCAHSTSLPSSTTFNSNGDISPTHRVTYYESQRTDAEITQSEEN